MLPESMWKAFIDVYPTKTNKEVAKIFNITVHAVEGMQSRLRTHFGIKLHKVAITDYRIEQYLRDGKFYYTKRDRKKQNATLRKRRAQVRATVLGRLGGKCCRCGFEDPRALQIDHPNGDARKDPNTRYDKNRGGGGSIRIFRLLRMSVEELKSTYQLLCANCNWIKRHENKEWA